MLQLAQRDKEVQALTTMLQAPSKAQHQASPSIGAASLTSSSGYTFPLPFLLSFQQILLDRVLPMPGHNLSFSTKQMIVI